MCKPVYYGFLEDEPVALRRVRILCFLWDFWSFYLHLVFTVITFVNNARNI